MQSKAEANGNVISLVINQNIVEIRILTWLLVDEKLSDQQSNYNSTWMYYQNFG